MRDATRDAMRDAIRFFASLIASLKLRDAIFLADRIPGANFRDAIEGCGPIASLIMHCLPTSNFMLLTVLQVHAFSMFLKKILVGDYIWFLNLRLVFVLLEGRSLHISWV